MRRGAILATMALAVWLGASALTVRGQSADATVTATLRIASACLVVSPAAVDFGTLEFIQPGAAPPRGATAPVTPRNCSSQAEAILARGSTATGGGVTWAQAPPGVDVCAGPNLFIQGIRDAGPAEKRLTLLDQPRKSVAGGATAPLTLTLVPPYTGSTGAGQTISVRSVFTATLAERGPC